MTVPIYKLTLLGDAYVGKTAILVQYFCENWVPDYEPTVEDSLRKAPCIDGTPVLLEIFDTAGTEQYSSVANQLDAETDGYIIVYSITSRKSFNVLPALYDQLITLKGTKNLKIVIAGNKCDLNEERQVSTAEGQELAKRWGSNCAFFETSAKKRINCEDVFIQIVRIIAANRKLSTNQNKMHLLIVVKFCKNNNKFSIKFEISSTLKRYNLVCYITIYFL
ncbi:Ras GTPase [Reticulomyxa filosa]|uniref:Ras GTPase n=1 Tax=Reticulomyxa filosa TaxID=46433 RepID=X6M8R2_RETFI|nr:Ras GTPase [Reticulomyxa filosa]|eukprot:ETO10046.1 Ras GTPase [Reticulomyxa filosa]